MRAAAESMIPLISAVGHETDVTLIDFASDRRAPTPTAAAEMAVPVRADLIAELMSKARRALACWQRAQDHRRTELRAAARALPNAEELLAIPRQRLDACAERLPRALRANAQIHHTQYSRIAGRLAPQLLRGTGRAPPRFGSTPARTGSAPRSRPTSETHQTRITRARDRVTTLGERAQARRSGADRHPRGAARALLSIAARLLLSRRAVARLCAGSRRRRPSAAHGRVGAARHERSTSSSPTAASAPRRRASAMPASRPPRRPSVPASWKPRKPKSGRRRLRPGKPVRVSAAGRTRQRRRTVRPSARADLSLRHRDVGALLLLRHEGAARAVHGEVPASARARADRHRLRRAERRRWSSCSARSTSSRCRRISTASTPASSI